MRKIIVSVLLLATVASCSSKKETAEAPATEPATTTAPAATDNVATADGVTKVTLTGDDQMKFDKAEIRVKAGSKVELTLTHSGKMAKDVMGHNFVLLKPGTDLAKFAAAAGNAKATDYVPANDAAVIASSQLIGGGESTALTFDAPAAGTYDFICSFPGHYAMMKGKFIVE